MALFVFPESLCCTFSVVLASQPSFCLFLRLGELLVPISLFLIRHLKGHWQAVVFS